jgi:general secretion pathway protein N
MIEALRRSGVRLALLGVAAYLVFLAVTLPASWVGYALERASGGALALGESRGTIWSGRGTLAARSGDGFRAIGDIQWRSNPLSIFTGKLNIAVTGSAPGADLKANVGVGLRSLRLQNLEASIPVSMLEPAIPGAALVKPQGRVRVTAESLEIGPASVRGAATAEWSEAGMSGIARIGDYRLQVTGNGDSAAIRLATLRGDLRVRGDGQWKAAEPRVVRMRGVAETSPDRKDLEPLLTLVAGGGSGNMRQFGWAVDL